MLVTNSYAICSSWARSACCGNEAVQFGTYIGLILKLHLHLWTQFFVHDWFITLLLLRFFGKSPCCWQTIYRMSLHAGICILQYIIHEFQCFFCWMIPLRYNNWCFLSIFQYVLPRKKYSAYLLLFLMQATCSMG
jgi:hypothetical protein